MYLSRVGVEAAKCATIYGKRNVVAAGRYMAWGAAAKTDSDVNLQYCGSVSLDVVRSNTPRLMNSEADFRDWS